MNTHNARPASPRRFPVWEYTLAGTLIAMFSIFLGFYAAAITFASQSYPELNLNLINLIHGRIIANLALMSVTALPLIAALFYLLGRRYAALTGTNGN